MQLAERALRGEGGARPLDRAGILAPSAFDTTVRYGASWCLCGGDGIFHCIHRSGDIDRRQSAANRAGADKHRAARPSHAVTAAPRISRRGALAFDTDCSSSMSPDARLLFFITACRAVLDRGKDAVPV